MKILRKVTIGAQDYPCAPNMGAMLRYERESGKAITESMSSISDMITYLWCCIKSACAAEGIEFPYSLMEMADRLDVTTLQEWRKSLEGDPTAADDDEPSKKN